MSLAVILSLLFAGEGKRSYWPTTIAAMTGAGPVRTHIQVEGFVTYVKKEADGDVHIRLCDTPSVKGMDRARCIVAECIPLLPCQSPKKGKHLRVKGIYRFDGERGHKWAEIHPAEYLEVIP